MNNDLDLYCVTMESLYIAKSTRKGVLMKDKSLMTITYNVIIMIAFGSFSISIAAYHFQIVNLICIKIYHKSGNSQC